MGALDLETLQRVLAMARRESSKALWVFLDEVAYAAPRYLTLVLPLLVHPNEAELRDMVLNE